MSIHPFRLDSISADNCATLQLEACRTELHRPFVHVAQNIFFTGAQGARDTAFSKIREASNFRVPSVHRRASSLPMTVMFSKPSCIALF